MSGLADGELESASDMASALSGGEVTSMELVERALGRAVAWQPSINAFSQLWAEEALAEAGRIDAVPARVRRPTAGVPAAVKDLYDVAGHETTGCCDAYRGKVASGDAPLVEALRREGLVLIGKTNQHELAAGGTNLVSACGRTGNPWDPERMTGGSSGGSGAAVAAGIVPWALGSDTGGSIRIPASMCGTLGLKPTNGRFTIDGMLPLAPTLDCPGPMGCTLRDTLALYLLMLGADAAAEHQALGTRGRPRIAVPGGLFADLVHDEVLGTVTEVASGLQEAGLAVEHVSGDGLESVRPVWKDVVGPEFSEAHPDLQAERRSLVAPSVVAWMEHGEAMTEDDRAAARTRHRAIRAWFQERLEGFDAMLVPTTPYPAPRADQLEVDLGRGRVVSVDRIGPGWMTSSINLAGLPALNLPAGWSIEGLPIGVSLVGKEGEELRLFRIAGVWEVESGFRLRRPAPP